ncbi:hypothetical protein HXX76_002461 [Chlamydomonas incerta]|uniref:DNA repair protein RAD50 n=1 Tax=Chlamydomonas incerta TaxID=51695 RepID=A0A835W7K2_CHLIN|nr:hypothetical protein HXX76_002461 [Chlamydomonas incerta]|eukprot:KAG2442375.1 hypothetical protein HXX76_002461 [Chlamydomonas incerta]
MCTVEKILIKGIRSFSPTNEYIIEFYKPLTIIVGSNGAGKTTIIEALRNATTGELPPNTRQGQGFVHDPKVAGESEVKAQIRLSFQTAMGQKIIVTRSFQLTQKKTTMQFKSLDASMSCTNRQTGQRETLTYRCGDLDRMVPSLMGVSKAILENVIFVHQEESNWPLAEGKVLKEKFDDIFAATKYTKALEAFRKLRTEKSQALKELKLELETLKQLKDMAAHHTAERDAAKARVADCQEQIKRLEAQIQELEASRGELEAKLAEIETHSRDITARAGQLEVVKAQNVERAQRFEAEGRQDYEEPTEELERFLKNADRAAADKEARLRALEGEANSARIAKEAAADGYQKHLVLHGKLAGEAATHTANIAERDRAMRDTALALALALPPEAEAAEGGGGAVSASGCEAFVGAVERRVRELEGRVQALRADARSNESRMSSAVDAANAQVARAQEGLRLKRGQIDKNHNDIAAAGAQIGSSQFTAASARSLKEDADAAEEAYRAKQALQAASDHHSALEEARGGLEATARRIAELRQERQRAAAAAESGAKLRVKRTDLESKQEQLERLLATRRRDLARALDLSPSDPLLAQPAAALGAAELAQLRPRSEAVLARLKAEEAARLKASQAAHSAAQTAKATAATKRAELQRCRTDFEALRQRLRDGMAAALAGGAAAAAAAAAAAEVAEDDFNNRMSAAQQSEDKGRNKLVEKQAMSRVMVRFRDSVAQHALCPVCTRGFGPGEQEACLNNIDENLKMLPQQIEQHTAKLQRLQSELSALRGLQPEWVRYSDLRTQLPGLEAGEAAARAEADDLADKAEAAQVDYAEAQERAREAGRLQPDLMWALDRLVAEVEGLRREVTALDTALGGNAAAGGAPLRSVSEIDRDLEDVEAERLRAELARDDAQKRVSRLADEVLTAQRSAMTAQQRAMEAASAVGRMAELERRISDLEAANTTLEGELAAAAASLAPLEAERDKLVKEREAARQEAAAEVQRAEEQLRDAQLHQAKLAARVATVADYEARGRAQELARAGEALERLKARLEECGRQLEAKEKEAMDIRQALQQDEADRRDIQDWIEHRRNLETEADLSRQLQEMEAQVARVGDQFELQRQSAALASRRDGLRSQVDVLCGHSAAAGAAAAKAQAELNHPKFRDIRPRFQLQQVTVKTTELAMGDLDKYYKALEKALLVFHTSKMADINKIIKEMWQKTYRGQDIDYIQIKADTEGAGARSYNYRVVMYSGAAELEMRGRCSAGQKVLACLIIRLALAETFCLNCGILALDEPTTNLDADNSASLAEALAALMKSRAGQENFQLIVITHDEHFAQAIGTREHVDTLWRVTKDPATQHTLVTPESLRD